MKRSILKWMDLFMVLAGCMTTTLVDAAPANPVPHDYWQPDGSSTSLYLKGDEYYSWLTDPNGYTVVRDSQGWYVYADKVDGQLVPTDLRVGDSEPQGLDKNLKTEKHHLPPSMLDLEEQVSSYHRSLQASTINAHCNYTEAATCRIRGLVLLVRFSDHRPDGPNPRDLPGPEDYDVLFNHNGPTDSTIAPTGSVADVFLENSYGKFVLESVVTPWLDVDRTEADAVDDWYGLNRNGTRWTWHAAMTMLEQSGFDLDQFDENGDGYFDSLVVLHSGVAAEYGGTDCETGKTSTQRVWSHATKSQWYTSPSGIKVGRFYVASGVWGDCPTNSTGSNYPGGQWDIARIGVIAHECAHYLGLPDLYDFSDNNGDGARGNGVGNYDMQANMWGWRDDQLNPPLLGAWSKYKLGWVNAIQVSHSDTFTLHQSCTSDTILRINHNMPDCEYFLLENRYPCGFDIDLKDKGGVTTKNKWGVAMWHIDECENPGVSVGYNTEGHPYDTTWPKMHYEVALVQGDGLFHLERGQNLGDQGDLFKRLDHADAAYAAYSIGPNGVKRNGGSQWTYSNTNAYSNGTEVPTGISIEFGAVGPAMTVTVTLEGTERPPSIGVTFTAPTRVTEPSGWGIFSVTVINTSSNTDPVTITSLTNDVYRDLNGKGSCTVPFTLAPGGSQSCTFMEEVSGNGGDQRWSMVSASGVDDENTPVSANSASRTLVLNRNPTLTVTTQASATTVPEPSGEVSFTVVVKNTSLRSDPVTLSRLSSDLFGDLNGKGNCVIGQTIQPSATYTCKFSGTIVGNGGETKTVTTFATGIDDEATSVAASHGVSVGISSVSAAPSTQPSVNDLNSGGFILFPTVEQSAPPSIKASEAPTSAPSSAPTILASDVPTVVSSGKPSSSPTAAPSAVPTVQHSFGPTGEPSSSPTTLASDVPTVVSSGKPSSSPTATPSAVPTVQHSLGPTAVPSSSPTTLASDVPTVVSSGKPSSSPTAAPSTVPTVQHSLGPTAVPSSSPTTLASDVPTVVSSGKPSSSPTASPSTQPSVDDLNSGGFILFPTVEQSAPPSIKASEAPTSVPSSVPTFLASDVPTMISSGKPSSSPTAAPSTVPTVQHSLGPTAVPSSSPTTLASDVPKVVSSGKPSGTPTAAPSAVPTVQHSVVPTSAPSVTPTAVPTSSHPTTSPSAVPSVSPTEQHSEGPTASPSTTPTSLPTSSHPTPSPSATPSASPTASPSAAPTDSPSSPPSPAPTDAPSASPSEKNISDMFSIVKNNPVLIETPAPTTPSPTPAPTIPSPTEKPKKVEQKVSNKEESESEEEAKKEKSKSEEEESKKEESESEEEEESKKEESKKTPEKTNNKKEINVRSSSGFVVDADVCSDKNQDKIRVVFKNEKGRFIRKRCKQIKKDKGECDLNVMYAFDTDNNKIASPGDEKTLGNVCEKQCQCQED